MQQEGQRYVDMLMSPTFQEEYVVHARARMAAQLSVNTTISLEVFLLLDPTVDLFFLKKKKSNATYTFYSIASRILVKSYMVFCSV